MGEVFAFTGQTTVAESPETLLEKAKGWRMDRCIVVGSDESGQLHFGGSISEIAEILLLLKRAERNIMDGMPE